MMEEGRGVFDTMEEGRVIVKMEDGRKSVALRRY